MSYDDGDPWDVWLMMAESPTFAAQPGDSILGAWDILTGVAIPDYPFDQALYDDVQPIGNEINAVTGTFDGPPNFTQHHVYLGNGVRYWGTVNQYPDDNQARHVVCTRFITEFATQFYHRVRFVLSAPFDKDNAPNALAILIYTDPERQNYFYTPGAFILDDTDPENTFWYADTTIGQSPIGHDEPVYYAVALGSAPLNGGGTVPVDEGHESWNWENNIIGAEAVAAYGLPFVLSAFITRMGWFGYATIINATDLEITHPDYPMNKKFITPDVDAFTRSYPVLTKPSWMSVSEFDALVVAINKASGREVINAAP
jgi:hypothetical protein